MDEFLQLLRRIKERHARNRDDLAGAVRLGATQTNWVASTPNFLHDRLAQENEAIAAIDREIDDYLRGRKNWEPSDADNRLLASR